MTAVNVLTSEPLTFDSSKQKITPKHILATTGYPSDNFPWVELEEGVYAWGLEQDITFKCDRSYTEDYRYLNSIWHSPETLFNC
jgi:hypothetical protein